MTPAAAKKVVQQLNRRGAGLGIRIGIKTTGCSGLAYVLEFVDNQLPSDVAIMTEGALVLIDEKSLAYVRGMVVDYVREGLNEGFKFHNPNERDRCGCGESFRV